MRLKTVTSNLEVHFAGFAINSLPQNFQDAIYITRQLGFRYLWIDSMCIIQDSPEDWQLESVVMGNIYEQAALTIFALAIKHSDAGIFDQSVLKSTPPEIICRIRNRTDSEQFDSVLLSRYFDMSARKSEHESLASRGWCLQESFLSHRRLSYSVDQIDFYCHKSLRSATDDANPQVYAIREPSNSGLQMLLQDLLEGRNHLSQQRVGDPSLLQLSAIRFKELHNI
jgi:hypothetical protein